MEGRLRFFFKKNDKNHKNFNDRVILKGEKLMERESEHGPMAQNILGISKMEKNMDLVNLSHQLGKVTLENGHLIKEMVLKNKSFALFLYFF